MREVPVTSRIIKSVYFSKEDGQLRLRFKNGEERRFEGVAATKVAEMCEAKSPGQYYIDHIRGQFRRIAA